MNEKLISDGTACLNNRKKRREMLQIDRYIVR